MAKIQVISSPSHPNDTIYAQSFKKNKKDLKKTPKTTNERKPNTKPKQNKQAKKTTKSSTEMYNKQLPGFDYNPINKIYLKKREMPFESLQDLRDNEKRIKGTSQPLPRSIPSLSASKPRERYSIKKEARFLTENGKFKVLHFTKPKSSNNNTRVISGCLEPGTDTLKHLSIAKNHWKGSFFNIMLNKPNPSKLIFTQSSPSKANSTFIQALVGVKKPDQSIFCPFSGYFMLVNRRYTIYLFDRYGVKRSSYSVSRHLDSRYQVGYGGFSHRNSQTGLHAIFLDSDRKFRGVGFSGLEASEINVNTFVFSVEFNVHRFVFDGVKFLGLLVNDRYELYLVDVKVLMDIDGKNERFSTYLRRLDFNFFVSDLKVSRFGKREENVLRGVVLSESNTIGVFTLSKSGKEGKWGFECEFRKISRFSGFELAGCSDHAVVLRKGARVCWLRGFGGGNEAGIEEIEFLEEKENLLNCGLIGPDEYLFEYKDGFYVMRWSGGKKNELKTC